MHLARSKSRSKSRSPAPPQNSQSSCPSPRPFLPPSHYAAANGISYPVAKPPSEIESVTSAKDHLQTNSQHRSSLLHISYPSHSSDSSFEFKSPDVQSDSAENSKRKSRPISSCSTRSKRSSMKNLPLLEANLLPSLRDTVDRMTRAPSRSSSKPPDASSSSTRINFSTLEPPPSGHWRSLSPSYVSNVSSTPKTSHFSSPLQSPSFESFAELQRTPQPGISGPARVSTPVETSTPKSTKSALKSALRAPTPNLNPVNLNVNPPSLSRSLRTVKSIIGGSRKPDAPTMKESSDDLMISTATYQTNENLVPPRVARARSRTDPGTLITSDGTTPRTTNPKPNRFVSNLPRRVDFASPRKDNPNVWRNTSRGGDSDLEYRYEMEGREKRRLKVTNAVVVPSSSESEGEAQMSDGKSKLPTFTVIRNRGVNSARPSVGLGLVYDRAPPKPKPSVSNDRKQNLNGEETRSLSEDSREIADSAHYSLLPSQESDASSERATRDCSSDTSSILSLGKSFYEANRRQTEALKGIVDDLEWGTTSSGQGFEHILGNETVYGGHDCVAIGSSGELLAADQQSMNVTEYSGQNDASDYGSADGEPETGMAPSSVHDMLERIPASQEHSTPLAGIPHLGRQMSYGAEYVASEIRSRSPAVDSHPPEKRADAATGEGRKSPYRSPIIRQSLLDLKIPAALRRQSVYQDVPAPNQRSMESRYNERQPFFDEARKSHPEVLTPSPLSHADSDLSSMGSTLWHDDYELSAGAETLFRKLSGSDRESVRRSQEKFSGEFGNSEDILHLGENPGVRSSRSFTTMSESSSDPSVYDDPTAADLEPKANSPTCSQMGHSPWRSSIGPSLYATLLEEHGEIEVRRQEIVWELRETERIFVDRLHSMLRLFVKPLRIQKRKVWISGVPSEIARLFDWVEDILNVHSQILAALQSAHENTKPIVHRAAEAIRKFVARFEVYQPYVVRVELVTNMIIGLINDRESEFGEFVRLTQLEVECDGWTLERFLLEPVKRLTVYPEIFKRLLELTAREHPDYLSTFSLLHSTEMVIRVLNEVRVREEEYDLIKDISQRIQGLPPHIHLARRERRLLTLGQLHRIDISGRVNAEAYSSHPPNHETSQANDEEEENRNSRLVEAINEWDFRRARSGSVKSTSSSATGVTFKTHKTALSSSSSTWLGRAPATTSHIRFQQKAKGTSVPNSPRSHNEASNLLHVLVFTDLVLFAIPTSSDQDDQTWRLAPDIAMARVIGISEFRDTLVEKAHVITLDVLQIDPNSLDTGVISESSKIQRINLCVPKCASNPSYDDLCMQWTIALKKCFQFTLRSLSFPSHSGGYLVHGPNVDLVSDTQQSVLSIVNSGLPLPKSPSCQIEEGKGADFRQREREERGWWSVRFQQVLREMQRQDITFMGSRRFI